jgi:hypothetical protein
MHTMLRVKTACTGKFTLVTHAELRVLHYVSFTADSPTWKRYTKSNQPRSRTVICSLAVQPHSGSLMIMM